MLDLHFRNFWTKLNGICVYKIQFRRNIQCINYYRHPFPLSYPTFIKAAVGILEPYHANHKSWNVLQYSLRRSTSGLYISLISKPAVNILSDVWEISEDKKHIQWTFKIYRLSSNQLTDVSIRPRHLFCSLSLSDEINRCIISMFKMLVGGLFRLMVAIPVMESTSCCTGVDDDDRKPNSRLIWWSTTIRWLRDPKIFDMDCIIYSRRGRRFCV